MLLVKKWAAVLLILILVLSFSACTAGGKETQTSGPESSSSDASSKASEGTSKASESTEGSLSGEAAESTEKASSESAEEGSSESTEPPIDEPAVEKNGDVYILFTSDVHCGIDSGFGYAGLYEIRRHLEEEGYTTILVDDGDSIQGETIGTLTKGDAIIDLMNCLKYDAAIPGNHEFDYGVERFLELTEKAEYPYISCNFTYEGELVLAPYVIKEAAGMKIAFVGVTTPTTITSSTPAYFKNSNGEYVYGFLQDETGEGLYSAVQKAVDDARAEGADYVYVLGHLGMAAGDSPWTYADVIAHTNGIDVFLDGHSHDTEQVVMKNKDGDPVVRSACGTKLGKIGYSHISKDQGIVDTNLYNWSDTVCAADLFGFTNEASDAVDERMAEMDELLNQVIASSPFTLTINDAEAVDASGSPIRMIRRAETNLGDFCADAFKESSGADIGLISGGCIRVSLEKGLITYGDIIRVFPFGNYLSVIEASGQQILDALEWGARVVPEECGGFLQVSGLSYEIHTAVPDSCLSDENGMCAGFEGERRIRNVLVNGEALDPEKLYTVAGPDYTLIGNGDGFTAFDGCTVLQNDAKLDNQMLIEFITGYLGGEIGEGYEDPYGEDRIVIIDEE